MRFFQSISLISSLILGLLGCKDPEPSATPFDKGALLENFADNLIIPAINEFSFNVDALQTSYEAFEVSPTPERLDIVKEKWITTYMSWQSIKMYDFGPFRDYAFKGATGIFPTDTTKVLDNITSGTYNLGTASNTDAIGLHSLDFLLYRPDALNDFTTNANYRTYGADVIQKIKDETDAIKASWSSYRSTFVASTGTESTSAFSELVNEFNRDYELAKNAKLGIPLGKQSLGIQLPEYIEARNSAISLDLLKNNIRHISRLYNGNSFANGTPGVGFDDYLVHLERSELSSTIQSNFNAILTKIDTFSGSLESEMSTNVSELDELYMLVQGQVVSLKTDMTSAFGVLITYQDNDGD